MILTKDLRPEMFELLNGLLDVVHRGMLTISGLDVLLVVPPMPKLFDRRNIDISVVQIALKLRHVLDQKASILPDRVAAEWGGAVTAVLAHQVHDLGFSAGQ